MKNKITITRQTRPSGHTVVMVEIKGRIYAATYAPDSDVSDAVVLADLRRHGYGARTRKGFVLTINRGGCIYDESETGIGLR